MGKIYSRKSFNCQRTFKNLGKLWYMRRVLSIETEIASLHKSFSSSDVTNDQYPYRCHHLFFLNQASQREVVIFLVMHNVSIYNLVIVTIVNIAASLFIVKIPSVATIATIITNIITTTITTMIFLVIQVSLIFSRVFWSISPSIIFDLEIQGLRNVNKSDLTIQLLIEETDNEHSSVYN